MFTRKPFDMLKNRGGFTLLELVIVMMILGLLAGLVGPKVWKSFAKGQKQTAKAQIARLGQSLDQFRLDNYRYPTTSEGLNALVTNPGIDTWDGPYLEKNVIPLDPWNRPYNYKAPGEKGDYDLYSYGKDGTPGGEGDNRDIVSWE